MSSASALDPGRGSGLLVATGAARARRCLGDRGPAGRQHIPGSTELGAALTGGVAGLAVALIAVKRVAVVGDLRLPVRARDRADQRGLRPAADRRLAARAQRGPCRGARAGARALAARVLLEQVEGLAL